MGVRRIGAAGAVFASMCGIAAWAATGALAVTDTFEYAAEPQAFKVPPGVKSLRVVAEGGAGGEGASFDPNFGGAGSLGAVVSGELEVTPRETLYVDVGGDGEDGGWTGGRGGSNGGGEGALLGGGGGGASDVRTVAPTEPMSLASRLLVAAGGGGGGASYWQMVGDNGGGGGNAEQAGADATCEAEDHYASGGWPGTYSQGGGAGGSVGPDGTRFSGQSGRLGEGGADWEGGGGGGAGLYGGGGGGFCTDGAGGGGGSNLVPPGGEAALAKAGARPSVSIAYMRPSCTTASGQGTFERLHEPDRLFVKDRLTTNTSGPELLQARYGSGTEAFQLRGLTFAECHYTATEGSFFGEGKTKHNEDVAFALRENEQGFKFEATVTGKDGTKMYEARGPLKTKNQKIE